MLCAACARVFGKFHKVWDVSDRACTNDFTSTMAWSRVMNFSARSVSDADAGPAPAAARTAALVKPRKSRLLEALLGR